MFTHKLVLMGSKKKNLQHPLSFHEDTINPIESIDPPLTFSMTPNMTDKTKVIRLHVWCELLMLGSLVTLLSPIGCSGQRPWVAHWEVASGTPWCLYRWCSAWELACININKSHCWGPPVRGHHHRGQRRDTSALTSRLISLSAFQKKKVGISAQSGIAFGSLSLQQDKWTPCSVLTLLFSSSSAALQKEGNPWGFEHGNPEGLSFSGFQCHRQW